MTRQLASLTLSLTVVVSVLAAEHPLRRQPPRPVASADVIRGAVVGAARTEVDTVYVLGGPDRLDGRFEDAAGNPSWNGWTHEDLTFDGSAHWHVSDFMAPGGQYAMWCGTEFDGDPGYGNRWVQSLEFRHAVADPSTGAAVIWTALLRVDTEPGYDFVYLQIDRGGEWETLEVHDGAALHAIDLAFAVEPGDYVGEEADEIRLRVRFESDGAWSDEDGLWETDGACQYDDVSVTVDGELVDFEDFEDQTSDRWEQVLDPGVGDYAALWSGLHDLDPCQDNHSPQVAFIDDGIVVPGTGGSPCVTWCYGPGGYIVNNTGGLMGPDHHILNRVLSPERPWPAGYEGAFLEFDYYVHEELGNYDEWPGIFLDWDLRSTADSLASPIAEAHWRDNLSGPGLYGGPRYRRYVRDVSTLLVPDCQQVQINLKVIEYGYVWGWVGTDGTPAPYFDNVAITAFPFDGPLMTAETSRLFNDNFPESGLLDLENLGTNNVRLDMALNIALADDLVNDPGDSIVVSINVLRAGASLVEMPRLRVRLLANPLFDPYRVLPANFSQVGDVVTGWVHGDSTYDSGGGLVADHYNFDLPDSGFFFPGDVLHYYVEASDEVAGDVATSIVPGDTTGYSDFTGHVYDDDFTVRALPSLRSPDGLEQPPVLFWDDAKVTWRWYGREHSSQRLVNDRHWLDALARLGYQPGVDYDLYTTMAARYGVGNGLGGRATAPQLAGYTTLLYSAGDMSEETLSNGDFETDPSRDLEVVSDWFALGDRNAFLTGDNLVSSLVDAGAQGIAFNQDYLGVVFADESVSDLIGGQHSPEVVALDGNGIVSRIPRWIAHGGCPRGFSDSSYPSERSRYFDAITAGPDAERLAEFADPDGNPGVYPYAAAIYHRRADQNARVVTMPVDLMFVRHAPGVAPPPGFEGIPTRAILLADVLEFFGESGGSAPVGAPPVAPLRFRHYPNPFNPRATIALDLPRAGTVGLKVFDLRGALVCTLHDERLPAGRHELVWDGTDQRGAAVASGVYFAELRALGEVRVQKLTLVR